MIMLAPQFTNALKDREIDLRGRKIMVIENLGATLDQFDTVDMTNNDIRKVGGFPILKRLKTLLLSSNRVQRFATGLEQLVPNLEELVLTNNMVKELGDLVPLASLPKLTQLSLLENPVTRIQHYRAFCIYKFPQLHILDYHKVKDAERQEAAKVFAGADGAALLAQIVKTSAGTTSAVVDDATGKVVAQPSGPSALEMQEIQRAIANAKTLDEVNALEARLKGGWSAKTADGDGMAVDQ